jgi:hypothetical protein
LSDERTFEISLPEGRVLVRYRGRATDLKFSVMLQTETVEGWQTVCLIDNSEDKGTHLHRYEGSRKMPSQVFHHSSPREDVPVACDFLREHAYDIIKAWLDR